MLIKDNFLFFEFLLNSICGKLINDVVFRLLKSFVNNYLLLTFEKKRRL